MSAKPNKVGRPKKELRAKSIYRVPILTEKELVMTKTKKKMRPLEKLANDPKFRVIIQNVTRKGYLVNAITDPHSQEKMPAKAFGYSLVVNDHDEDESMGAMLCEFMRDMSADDLQKVFDSIMRMKRNAEFWHRNSYAYDAYNKYIETYGREPSKNALKCFIIDHPREFRDAPDPDEKSGWTRLWKAVGLEKLKSK